MRTTHPRTQATRQPLLILGRTRIVARRLETAATSLGYSPHHASGVDDVAAGLPAYGHVLAHASSLKRHDGNRLAQVARDGQLVAVVERGHLLEAIALAECASAWLVFDEASECSPAALTIALGGYCGFPADLAPAIALDQQRLRAVQALNQEERDVLSVLGRGEGDRMIAHRLSLPTGRVTYLVRRLTERFGFTNRQATAVFAARHALTERRVGG